MKYSIATVSVSGTLDKKLQAIAAAGFDAVEIFESDFISFDGSASDVAKMCRGHRFAAHLQQRLACFAWRH